VNLGPKINSGTWDLSPRISADGLTLCFHSYRGGYGGEDIWLATRATKNDPWNDPVLHLRLSRPVGCVQDSPKTAYADFAIGAAKDLAPGTFWAGLIDDVRIYNRAVKP
jgi:hypothetical protein